MSFRSRGSSVVTRTLSPQVYLRVAIAALVGLVVIVPSGGLVRLTGSGLGCPDWPTCQDGDILPATAGHALIEYSNRVLSFLIVLVVLGSAFLAHRLPNAPRALRRWSLFAAVATLAQGPLGGLTVLFDLHPVLVSSHFLLSIVALGGGVVVVITARDHRRGTLRVTDRRAARVAGVMLVLLAAVIVTGVLVTSSGPHSGDPAVVRRFWSLSAAAAVHVRVVIAFVIGGVVCVWWLRRSGGADRAVRRLTTIFAVLLAAQIAVGEYQYRNYLPWEVILVHVTIAGLLAATGVALAWLIGHPERQPSASEISPASQAVRQAANTDIA